MDSSLPGFAPGQRLVEPLAAALAAKGPVYRPRTEHLNDDGSPIYTNRLILETSPYLLQHAHNPVSWHAWGDAPFDRARTENKLVLLSVGYSTCHWCHVMERESFEDTEVAAFMNERFVSIKVDREERPDVDGAYMAAVQLMTGRGGWPMTVVLTPDRRPVFGGTYFPARDGDRGTPIGFLSILRQLDAQWRADPGSLIGQAQYISSRIRRASEGDVPADVPGAGAIRAGVSYLESTFDPTWGGFGRAPKFPRPATLELLARYHRRTRDRGVLRMLVTTLERIAAGGIVDHIGGGFHRYSTDAAWLVPHFEKMLYDQAQLAIVYLEAYQITGRQDFARVARETLDYVSREMTDDGGGFYSATDADSAAPNGESEEGLFFTWTPAELDAVLGAERSRLVQAAFAVTANGDLEGRNVLHRPRPVETVAQQLGLETPALQRELDLARAALYEARSMRTPPLRDDKVITAWNGLMISAFARGGRALDNDDDVEAAARAARFVLTELRQHGRLKRTWRRVAGDTDAFLDDYAFLIAGLIDLYEATGKLSWLQEALGLQHELDTQFWDARNGGYTFTGSLHEDLLARDKPSYDGAEPAGSSVAALNLLRLFQLTDVPAYREAAERLFAAHGGQLAGGVALPKMLTALDFYLDRPVQVVIVAPRDGEKGLRPLLDTLHAMFLPNRVVVVGAEGEELAAQSELVPVAGGKRALGGKATAFVCRGNVCEPPTSDPAVLAELLAAADPLPSGGRIGC